MAILLNSSRRWQWWSILGRCLVVDFVYRLAAFVILWPLIGLVFQIMLAVTGSEAIADHDLLWFVLSPFGIFACTVAAALALSVLALELASSMIVVQAAARGQPLEILDAMRLGLSSALPILRLSLRIVVRALLLVIPFVALIAAIYFSLLSKFDINYYLAEKPSAFWVSAPLIALILLSMSIVLIPRLLSWTVALPLVLFENVSPRIALRISTQRTRGHRRRIGWALAGWALSSFVVASVTTAVVLLAARSILSLTQGSVTLLVPIIGTLVLVFMGLSTLISALQVVSLAWLIAWVYAQVRADQKSESFSVWRTRHESARRSVSRGAMLLGIGGTAVAGTLLGVWLLRGVRIEDRVVVIAHRGASALAPENTLAAFRRAIEDDADQVELDVQLSADGTVVVVHDSDLMKLAGVDLKIWNATIDELGEIDVGSHFSPQYSGERVPRLVDALRVCKGKTIVNIELKDYGHGSGLEERVVEVVENEGMESQVVAMSLERRIVQNLKKLRPNWRVGLLAARAIGDLTNTESDFLAVNTGIADRPFIRKAHRRGKLVYVWTVNDPAHLSHMISMGVDGVITDDPRMARAVLTERAELSAVERLLISLAFWAGVIPERISEQ